MLTEPLALTEPPALVERLPTTLAIREAAARAVTVSGALPLTAMTRLQGLLAAGTAFESAVEATLAAASIAFSRDPAGRIIARLSVAATVAVNCQRCLGRMPIEIRAEQCVAAVSDDRMARQLPSELEPWLVPGERGDLWQLVEDELILSLPMISRHAAEDCSTIALRYCRALPTAPADSPFKVLQRAPGELQYVRPD